MVQDVWGRKTRLPLPQGVRDESKFVGTEEMLSLLQNGTNILEKSGRRNERREQR